MLEFREACELMDQDWRADSDNRDDALEDLRFIAGDQWDQTERNQRETEGRPCLTINQLPQFVNQVAGDIRQAAPGIEVFPVDSAEDVGVAEVYEGLIRQIEYRSGATNAYAHGVESAIRCGIGHWRVTTRYTTDSVFEQEIGVERILDPLSVVWDAGAVALDRSDAMHCWVTEWVHKSEWKRRFKDAKREGIDIPVDDTRGSTGLYWRRDDFVRIAEYWYLKEVTRNLVLTADGRTLDVTEFGEDALIRLQAAGQVVRARKVDSFKVCRRVMDGHDWLGDEEDWAGRYIPIVPCLGAEVAFDGKIVRHGLVRFAKDPQKLYNYYRSAAAEAIGKSPKAPWTVTADMIKGYEAYWNNANRSNLPYLPYNPDPNSPTLRPERQQPPQIPAAFWQEAGIARDDMKATTGIFDASLGEQGNETSGRAILARQREGDVGSFLYTDNFRCAMQRHGQILIDLIPRIYDTERQVRILDVTGEEMFVPINVEAIAPDGQRMLVNDLNDGRFDVRVKVGASYTTARIEAREQMMEALQSSPNLWPIIGDLVFKNSDYPGADEIAERLKRAIDPKLLGEDAEVQPDPMQAAAVELELAGKQAEVELKRAQAAKAVREAEMAGAGEPTDPQRRVLELGKLRAEINAIQAKAVEPKLDAEKLQIEREKIRSSEFQRFLDRRLAPQTGDEGASPKPAAEPGREQLVAEFGALKAEFNRVAEAMTAPRDIVLRRSGDRITGGRMTFTE